MRKLIFFTILFCLSCQVNLTKHADLVILNGNIATLDEENLNPEAIALSNGKIMAVGPEGEIRDLIGEDTKILDAEGLFVMPGLIEGHGHLSGLGTSLSNLNFLNASSWEEITESIGIRAENLEDGIWIYGSGWHQEKWDSTPVKNLFGYPYHNDLSAVSPDNPVLLKHASGHAILVNQAAMKYAGVSVETPNPSGGAILRDERGDPIGIFEENATALIERAYKEYLAKRTPREELAEWYKGISLAQKECLAKGITSFQDAGSGLDMIERYKTMARNGELDLRLWVMIRDDLDRLRSAISAFPIVGYADDFLTVRAIKAMVDGALGSFGAWLLRPYYDKSGFTGQNTTDISKLRENGNFAIENGLQYCVHAIGDRGNRTVLDIFEQIFNEHPDKQDLRWRIEHAQHLDTADIPRFADLQVIASVQGIHCTSDAPFVEKRLGLFRARHGSYAWRSLLDHGVVIANGTDTPVEDVNPFASIYASVTRRRVDDGMVFYPEQKMTRKEALHSYTLGNAYAAFEEKIKGSLEVGKLADVVVLSKDLLNCEDEEILETEVIYSIVGGEVKYKAPNSKPLNSANPRNRPIAE